MKTTRQTWGVGIKPPKFTHVEKPSYPALEYGPCAPNSTEKELAGFASKPLDPNIQTAKPPLYIHKPTKTTNELHHVHVEMRACQTRGPTNSYKPCRSLRSPWPSPPSTRLPCTILVPVAACNTTNSTSSMFLVTHQICPKHTYSTSCPALLVTTQRPNLYGQHS